MFRHRYPLAALLVAGLRRQTQVHAVRARVDADARVRGLEEIADHLVDRSLADTGRFQRAGHEH